MAKSPRPIENSEIQDLLDMKLPKDHALKQLYPRDEEEAYLSLTSHPFTKILGGHPQAISLAAPMLEYKKLPELFTEFCRNQFQALDYNRGEAAFTSLKASLDISLDHLKAKDPEAMTLFMFMGLLPGGIAEKDLASMMDNDKWISHKDILLRASLIVKKECEGEPTYSLLPFMAYQAVELLEQDQELWMKFHLRVCRFYKKFCKSVYEEDDSVFNHLKELTDQETNIWACINRGINRKRDIIFEYEEDDENSDSRSRSRSSQPRPA
jgi:hypothetical protein